MAAKRCLNLVSPNEGEKTMCPQQVELSASLMNKKQRNVVAGHELGKDEKQTGKCIFELGLLVESPVEMTMIRNRVGNFLEACHWCEKKLKNGKDVYMYWNHGAFCSPECRVIQIISDGYHLSKSD